MWSLSAGLLVVASGAADVELVFALESLPEGAAEPDAAGALVDAAEPGTVSPVAEAAGALLAPADDAPAGAEAALLVALVAVPASALAAAWNASKLFAAVGFTAKTMPASQWLAGLEGERA